MRLKKLILQGFKSFADRTEFVFDSPITGIVGPNGCGKSNVVDGFKWVLGEQSAKSLRGDAMMDVTFNGSGNRKPAGLAEVTLVFENPKRIDDTRLLNLDTDEVSVGRRLFRDGTSEYQINNQTSRLKDIRDLFLDTGVGVDAYSVIEQGRVAALLEANPEERRLIFEEAAGISKYKVKKKEAQRKLEKVEQMESAQHRQQFAQQQLAQIAEQLAAFEQDLIAAQRKLADVEQTLSTETNELQKLTDELEQQKRLIDERQQAFRDGQLQLNSLSQEIEQNKAAILDLMRRAASVNSRIASIEIEHKNIAAQQARLEVRWQIDGSELEQLDEQRSG